MWPQGFQGCPWPPSVSCSFRVAATLKGLEGLDVCMYVCIYMYVRMYVFMYVCVCMCVCTYFHTLGIGLSRVVL